MNDIQNGCLSVNVQCWPSQRRGPRIFVPDLKHREVMCNKTRRLGADISLRDDLHLVTR
jgi:hypothetical protein